MSTTEVHARTRRLRRSDCAGRGLRRVRRGRGFSYVDDEGAAVTDADTLERLRTMAIPPAWKEVWICPDPMGHLQATGIDAAGRKQYLYHSKWREHETARSSPACWSSEAPSRACDGASSPSWVV